MKLETLTVELRPRSSWEAMELGAALVRRHARAIWLPWCIVTGLAFALVTLGTWAIDHLWLTWVLMWWLRPVFDRVPMYVLSRAVFGSVPGTAETLRAQLRWGWKPMLGHLTWRRFSPMRAAMLPVDLLEGAVAARLAERRRVIGGGISGPAMLLTLACLHFLFALQLSVVLLAVLFVPNEMLPGAARGVWELIEDGVPDALQIALNAVDWLAVAFIEPFFIGAGFGLYLNRRTQLEAWDLEIAFRRLRRRLETAGLSAIAVAVLGFALWLPMARPALACEGEACAPPKSGQVAEAPAKPAGGDAPAAPAAPAAGETADQAEDAEESGDIETRTLQEIFGEDTVAHEAFGKSVARAYQDPDLRPKRNVTTWEARDRDKKKPEKKEDETDLSALKWLSNLVGFVIENALWLLFGLLLLVLATTARTWWPWLRGIGATPEEAPEPVESTPLSLAEPLPPDVAAVARRLWAEGQPRRALALLYRASVAAMTARLDAHPPPGATEADCLRLSRRLPEAEDREAFRQIVRVWQYAAYGHSLPAADEFEALVGTLAARFRWAA